MAGGPLSGSWFVFRGKRGNRLKILYWDHDGYALWSKRLERGTFEWPAVTPGMAGVEVRATDLALILGGVALSAERRKRYHRPIERCEEPIVAAGKPEAGLFDGVAGFAESSERRVEQADVINRSPGFRRRRTRQHREFFAGDFTGAAVKHEAGFGHDEIPLAVKDRGFGKMPK